MDPGSLLRSLLKLRGEARVIGGMTPKPIQPVAELCKLFIDENAGDPKSYPAVEESIRYIIKTISRMAFNRIYSGWVTSGASEANLLALYAAREEGYRRVVYPASAHYSIPKSARLLGMEAVEVEVEDGYRPRLDVIEEVAGRGDVLVATIGTTETGFIDPVKRLREIALEKGARIHVDAAFTGPIIRYLDPGKVPEMLDDVVATISIDLHKIPEAPMGVGVLLSSSDRIIRRLFNKAPYIPSGEQFGVLGTRPGCPVVAGAYSLALLEERGVGRVAGELMNASRRIVEELEAHGYHTPHRIETPILCLLHDDIHRVTGRINSMGYRVYRCLYGKGIRVAVMPHIARRPEEVIDVLSRASRGVR
ncbi:MAG: aminotransferase class V-fold PLP-dependent enzyme [Desulfurococcales archaeon]|nr:aminotransferase class V-fold PLP-dependent enzyme [Desulfurococcales archaeon]